MEAPDSANTEMNYDHVESTIQPEETQPEAEEAVGPKARSMHVFGI